jgi:hypothetical protein
MRKSLITVLFAMAAGAAFAQVPPGTAPAAETLRNVEPTQSTVGPHDQTGKHADTGAKGKKPSKHRKQATTKPHKTEDAASAAREAGSGSTPTGAHGTGTMGSSPISGNNGTAGAVGTGPSGNTNVPAGAGNR